MKKVLIISYFFPPCTLTAAQRTGSWASELHKNGYYPIVISRRWNHPLKSLKDCSIPSKGDVLHEKNDRFESYHLPYKGNMRDRMLTKYGEGKFSMFRRMLTLLELILQPLFLSIIPFHNMYKQAEKVLKENPEIEKVVISGNLFIQFRFGYLLQKKFAVKWVADYRDAWTTSEINQLERSKLFSLLEPYEQYFEKKWVGSASKITSVSKPLADGISELVGVGNEVLYNGFVAKDFEVAENRVPFEDFTITYIGTLYEGQDVGLFCNALKRFIDVHSGSRVKFLLPGLAINPVQRKRIENLLEGYEQYFECTERIPKKEVLEIELRSHLLLHVAWKGFKGIVASKIYEYLASGTTILVTPGDDGSIDEIIKASECGKVANSEEEILAVLEELYEEFLKGNKIVNNIEHPRVQQYARSEQTKKLSEILDNL
ncbi:hypothetical protein R9C00_07745 [Flammeovirgaceae bacterium SG7u.111]|nr:hypothetical protein [Flammeovirgaceae bacterium SG7u.132]WPO37339.1 hypothetical protein R9C00_07745 [Flammeovirgaceae bacterium SG7u.111]